MVCGDGKVGMANPSGPLVRTPRRAKDRLLLHVPFLICVVGFVTMCFGLNAVAQNPLPASGTGSLRDRISVQVRALGYSEETAQSVIDLTETWKTRKGRVLLDECFARLLKARHDHEQGNLSKKGMADVQETATEKLVKLIRDHIGYNENVFDLTEVADSQQAQCLGVTQLYYVLGKAVGLTVVPISVIEVQGTRELPPGCGHVACLVELADSKSVMLDVLPRGLTSIPFTLDVQYTQEGPYHILQNKRK